jgi:tetratricopeptide (TPR) repeat protein/GGDEF domain-containing protein
MSETDKRLERAKRNAEKGRNDAALREYLEVLREQPAHEAAAQAAAELYQSLGQRSAAVDLLLGVFARQAALAQETAAISTYRKLLKLTTPPPECSMAAARFLEKIGGREAVDAYLAASRGFRAAGRKLEALAMLEAVAAIDPSVQSWCQLGELAAQFGDRSKAVNAFLRAGDLEASGIDQVFRAVELYGRAYTADPANLRGALAYARALLSSGGGDNASKAAAVLQPFGTGPGAAPETRSAYGRALVAADRIREAEPFLWLLIDQDPANTQYVVRLIGEALDGAHEPEAVALARRLEQKQRTAGRLREHAAAMAALAGRHAPGIAFLEYLVDLFNAANREAEYCATLLQLFELHYAAGNFLKAADCLDRAAEVDPYEPGHQQRLGMLQGKVAANRLRLTTDRLQGAVKGGPVSVPVPGLAAAAEPTVLEDLMLQAEIFLRYSQRPQAVERLERIRKLFPEEAATNQKLRELYAGAGMSVPAASPRPGSPPPADEAAADNIARVTEITRNIQRQGNPKSILFTAVNEAGRLWQASRCVAVLCTPGKPPSLALEYCAPGIQASDVHLIVKFVALLQPLVIGKGTMVLGNAAGQPSVATPKQFVEMGITSLLVTPLLEGEEHIGLLLLAECGAKRNWRPADTLVLKTIADQVVLALSHARLRRLVRDLAITDEKSGLLKRSSYLEVLLSEAERARSRKSAVTVVLLNFGKPAELAREQGETAVESMLQPIGQLVSSHIRQNDVAVRYDLTTIALILADTDDKNALFTLDRLRALWADLRSPDGAKVPAVKVGVAEAVIRAELDPVDVVTEIINRVETALQIAATTADGQCVLPPLP